MKPTAARFLSLSFVALPMLAPMLPAKAQAWPVKPVRVVVPAGAGGAADILARTLAEPMGGAFSTSFIVDNRPGAGGVIGSEIVARAPGDGYTLMVSSNTLIIAPSLYRVSYDVQRDFTAIGSIASAPNLLVASPELKVKTLAELIALARRTSGGLAYGSPAVGSAAHLTVELLARAAGIELVHVPFKSPQQAMIETISGRIPLTVAGVSNALPHLQGGKLVAIANMGAARSRLVPDVPTPAESGIKGVDLVLWFGMFAPASTPSALVARINQQLNAALKSPSTQARLESLGFDPAVGTPAQFNDQVQREEPIFARVVRDSGIKAD
ncbi:MAG: tripartite tricarboxylate transporter substrate-binding protein [Pseudomonadota bacterium]